MTSQDKENVKSQSAKQDAPTIIEDADKPSMGGEPVKPRRIDRKVVLMAEEPSPSRATRNTMEPLPKRRRKPSDGPGDLEEQRAPDDAPEVDEEGPGYIRLRVHVDEGDMTVRDARFVAGPLNKLSDEVTPGLNYEAKVGRRRVAVGDIPETTEWRGYPDPTGRPELQGHHIVEQTSYDFTVRIPADQIEESSLQDLRIDLFRWKGRGPGDHIDITELSKEPKAAVERLASLRGVEPKATGDQVEKRLKSAFQAARKSTER